MFFFFQEISSITKLFTEKTYSDAAVKKFENFGNCNKMKYVPMGRVEKGGFQLSKSIPSFEQKYCVAAVKKIEKL